MATFKFLFNTQTGHINIGTIGITITPDPLVVTGYYAFGVVAPNGQVFKAISPNFYTNPTGGSSDFDALNNTVITDTLTSIPLDNNGNYMSGDYKLSVAYVENLSNNTVNQRNITTVTYNYCNSKVGGTYKGKLTSKFRTLTNELIVNDVTDYTGATITSHLISSVLLSGGAAITTTSYSQTLPLAGYISTLTANGNRLYATIYGDITIQLLFTVTATINTPTDYITFKELIDKAKLVIRTIQGRRCKALVLGIGDANKMMDITASLSIISAYGQIADDIALNEELARLNQYLLKC